MFVIIDCIPSEGIKKDKFVYKRTRFSPRLAVSQDKEGISYYQVYLLYFSFSFFSFTWLQIFFIIIGCTPSKQQHKEGAVRVTRSSPRFQKEKPSSQSKAFIVFYQFYSLFLFCFYKYLVLIYCTFFFIIIGCTPSKRQHKEGAVQVTRSSPRFQKEKPSRQPKQQHKEGAVRKTRSSPRFQKEKASSQSVEGMAYHHELLYHELSLFCWNNVCLAFVI